MNNQDKKLVMVQAGFRVKNNGILSASLDPISYGKLKFLRQKYPTGILTDMFKDWIDGVVDNRSLEDIEYKEIDLPTISYKYSDYRFNSFFIGDEYKHKLKRMALDYNITVSTIVRFFLNTTN